MTDKPELMPDAVHISLWKLSEDTALLSIQDETKEDAVKYHSDPVYQAACAERDALRALCEGVAGEAGFLCDRLDDFDPDCADAAREFHGHVSPSHARLKKALAAYEKHKGVG